MIYSNNQELYNYNNGFSNVKSGLYRELLIKYSRFLYTAKRTNELLYMYNDDNINADIGRWVIWEV